MRTILVLKLEAALPILSLKDFIVFYYSRSREFILLFWFSFLDRGNTSEIASKLKPSKSLKFSIHLYHHAYTLPKGTFGVNYGISLSLWDYIFRTNHVPEDSGTIELGYPGDEKMPHSFWGQLIYGFKGTFKAKAKRN